MSNNRQKTLSPFINVTPLIDVLLVLLIIFMVVSPLRPARFKALIPQPPTEDQRIEANPLTLVVSISRDLRLKLNQAEDVGSVSELSKLSAELASTFQQRKQAHTYRRELVPQQNLPAEEKVEKTVFIKAPRSIPYGAVAKVIDGIKGAGASPIGLQIDDLSQ